MLKKTFLFGALFSRAMLIAQQMSPIDMVINPLVERLAISGIGGFNTGALSGNIANSSSNGLGSSLQFGLDWNPMVKEHENKSISVLALSLKINPVLNTRQINRDSLNIKKLTLVDNEHLFQFGLRHRYIKHLGEENAKLSLNTYGDFFYTPYKVRVDSQTTAEFNTLNVSVGHQAAFIQQFGVGDLNLGLSLQGNFLQIINPSDTNAGFERAIRNPNNLALPKQYLGLGGRVTLQFNDFNLFADMRKFWAVDKNIIVPGINDKLFVNIGAVVFGTAIRSRAKTPKD